MYTKAMMYTIQDTDLISTSSSEERAYVLKIRDLPDTLKPREKLIDLGPNSLTLQELLAVVLNTGSKKEGVLEMAQRVVKEYGTSALAGQVDVASLVQELDIPEGKACQIIAVAEIGRRLFKRTDTGLAVIRTARDVHDYVKDMHNLPKEQLRGLYLDTHNRVIHQEVISIGTINSNIIHPREVFRPALEYGAAAVVLVHNHPSGVSTPSTADIEITKQIIQAGRIIGIHLLDHVVVAGDTYTSVQVEY
jgi:DNA repair protein RadC